MGIRMDGKTQIQTDRQTVDRQTKVAEGMDSGVKPLMLCNRKKGYIIKLCYVFEKYRRLLWEGLGPSAET